MKLPFSVGGPITAIKDRKFAVSADGSSIKGEFADNCTVSLDVSDYSLARAGDSVDAMGWKYTNQQNQMFATRLTIVSEQPLISPDDMKKRRAQERQSDKKTKQSDATSGKGSAEARKTEQEASDK
jgi:hypothetical protein